MIEPTAEELAALRAAHGDAMRLTPPIPVGTEKMRIAMRVFDSSTYDRFCDEVVTTPETAVDNAFKRHLVWPTVEECARRTYAMANLPQLVIGALESRAIGRAPNAMAATSEPLTADVSDAVLAEVRLDRAKATELLSQAAPGGVALELVTLRGGGGLVLRAPEPVVFAHLENALRAKKGVAVAARTATMACVSWCSEDKDTLFSRLPGLPAAVAMPVIRRLGGAGSEHSFCFDD